MRLCKVHFNTITYLLLRYHQKFLQNSLRHHRRRHRHHRLQCRHHHRHQERHRRHHRHRHRRMIDGQLRRFCDVSYDGDELGLKRQSTLYYPIH